MPVESVSLGDDNNTGGGGDPDGAANAQPGATRVERGVEMPPDSALPNVQLGAQPDIRALPPDLEIRADADRTLPDSSEAKDKLNNVGKADPKDGQAQGKGKGGTGSGGGQGSGTGPGTGSGAGPGSAGSIRQARNKRWVMSFSTIGGQDYLHQLSVLGAVVVAEYQDGTRIMFRKLDKSPVPAEPIDSDIYTRMVWVDERPGAVSELAGAMGVERTPSAIRVYFPTKLEAELLSKELKYRGKKEEEIHSTVFRVFCQGNSYRFEVTEQKYN
jgi:hypothetical protein